MLLTNSNYTESQSWKLEPWQSSVEEYLSLHQAIIPRSYHPFSTPYGYGFYYSLDNVALASSRDDCKRSSTVSIEATTTTKLTIPHIFILVAKLIEKLILSIKISHYVSTDHATKTSFHQLSEVVTGELSRRSTAQRTIFETLTLTHSLKDVLPLNILTWQWNHGLSTILENPKLRGIQKFQIKNTAEK